MESKAAEEVPQKHEKLLTDGEKNRIQEVELMQNKFTKNIASPFLSQSKNWDDQEHWQIPDDLRENIEDSLKFEKPSNIQAVSIPMIVKPPHHDLIVQAPNGSGKTGSFAIGSTLRVDRANPKPQVIVMANTRELVNQIHSVYERLVKGTGITLQNFCFNTAPA